MKTVTEHLRSHLLEAAGYHEPDPIQTPTPEEILGTEWSEDLEMMMTKGLFWWFLQDSTGGRYRKFKLFIQLAKNRLVMGFLRYGSILKKKKKKSYNRVDSVRQRLSLYEDVVTGGNAEHLVDSMNICAMEYISEDHPNFHWEAQDDAVHISKT